MVVMGWMRMMLPGRVAVAISVSEEGALDPRGVMNASARAR